MNEKTTKTFKEIRDFNMIAGTFLRKGNNMQSKLGYAIKKISDVQIKNIVKGYQDERGEDYYNSVEKIAIDAALVDKDTKAILNAPKGSDRPFLYDKAGLTRLIDAERGYNKKWEIKLDEWDLKTFELDTFYVTDVPIDLNEEEVNTMKGFVIDPTYVLPINTEVALTPEEEAALKS